MDAVATTGLYPPANNPEHEPGIDGLIQLAARTNTPASRVSDASQQLIYRGGNRPFETPVIKRDELGPTALDKAVHPFLSLFISLVNPAWIFHDSLRDSEVVMLDPREIKFFQELIEHYLYPLVEDKDHQKKMVRDLKSLRNNGCFIFFMINTLWLVIIFSLQLVSERIRDYVFIPIKRLHNDPLRFEPLGFAFLGFFASILLVQFVSMLWHRYGTLLHLLASTDLKICQRTKKKNHRHHRRGEFNTDNVEDAVEQVKALQQLKGFDEEDLPEPDYDEQETTVRGKQVSEPDLSSTGLVYRGSGLQYVKQSACASEQWAKANDMQRNLDMTDQSEISGAGGGYNSESVRTYGSNYEAMKRRQVSNKRHLYNKSLDHVFKSRYQALSQNKTSQQVPKNPRGKLIDVFEQQQLASTRRQADQPSVSSETAPMPTRKQRRKSHERHLEHL